MSYSVKKAGIAFKAKVETGPDLSGIADGFSVLYINDLDGAKTDITGAFTESADVAGLYFSPEITIPAVGDYTLVITNVDAGMDNYPTPIVVTSASIDDVKGAVDALQVTANTIAADVDGLDGQNLQDIKDNLAAIKLLIDDEDGTAVNSVMEFVAQIDAALADSGTGLAALAGFTDDVENMLLGTEFLADGADNPLFGADNASLKALIESNLIQLQTDITTAKDAVIASIDASKTEILDAVAIVKTVVDANEAKLTDAGYGLEALKVLLDTIVTNVDSTKTDIMAVITDATKGLVGIYDTMVSRFDSVDSQLATIDSKVDAIGGSQNFSVFA